MSDGTISGTLVGVLVFEHGTFTMSGGVISDNSANGVENYEGGVFNMTGGTISENEDSGVLSAGTFNMSGNAEISGNGSEIYGGNGVGSWGTFNMTGGVISDNGANGVYNDGIFNMSGTAEISDNKHNGVYNDGTFNMSGTAEITGNGLGLHGGHGVSNVDGTFTMSGGVISGNEYNGVGNVNNWSTFIMTGGDISDNEVGVGNWGTFTMSGGDISDNELGVWNDGTFTMSGAAAITVNDYYGVLNWDTFNMQGGTISENEDSGVWNIGVFTMTGGAISDNDLMGVANGAWDKINDVWVLIPTTFTMSSGAISGNSGGVGNWDTFTMTGGTISDSEWGVDNGGVFNMSGGLISGNDDTGVANGRWFWDPYTDEISFIPGTFTMTGAAAITNNSWVGVQNRSVFNMQGGNISGNEYGILGWGEESVSTMTGGTISGNSDWAVDMRTSSKFIMTGGTINNPDHAIWGEGWYNPDPEFYAPPAVIYLHNRANVTGDVGVFGYAILIERTGTSFASGSNVGSVTWSECTYPYCCCCCNDPCPGYEYCQCEVINSAAAIWAVSGGLHGVSYTVNPGVTAGFIRIPGVTVVTPSPGTPSLGGGGGGPAPPVSIPSGDGVSFTGTVAAGNVTLQMPTNTVDQLIAASDNTATIDVSGVARAASATVPTAAMAQLVGAELGVELKLPQGTVTLDAGALASTVDAAGANVSVSLRQVENNSLPAAQRSEVSSGDVVFSISVSSGNQAIRNFDGTVTVTVNVPITAPLPAVVWHLSDAGELTRIESTFDPVARTVTFTTNRLSIYLLRQDAAAAPPAPAAPTATVISLTIGSRAFTVNGASRSMDVEPFITENRTMVPLRFVAEALGADVTWDHDARTAVIRLGGQTLRVEIDVLAPGMDAPAILRDNRTFVPIRFVTEALGGQVEWDHDNQVVEITKVR